MTIKKQFSKIKENWLLLLIIIILFILISSLNSSFSLTSIISPIEKMVVDQSFAYGRGFIPPIQQDFAPDVKDRVIIKTASMTNEVERGKFKEAESKLMDIVRSSDSFILNQNVNKYGTDRSLYYSGDYQLKVESSKSDSVVSQLKTIGEVKSFNENEVDITGSYTNLKIQIDAEKERLQRFKEMFNEAKDINDKIQLTNLIFDQERTIKYLEDSLNNINQDVQYLTVYITITEKQSEYKDILFIKISEIVKSFVNSLNNLIRLIFVLAPWIVVIGVIYFIYKRYSK